MSLAYLYGVGPASHLAGGVVGVATAAGNVTTAIRLVGAVSVSSSGWATFEPLAGDVATGWTRPASVLAWQRGAAVSSWQAPTRTVTWQGPATVLEWRAA